MNATTKVTGCPVVVNCTSLMVIRSGGKFIVTTGRRAFIAEFATKGKAVKHMNTLAATVLAQTSNNREAERLVNEMAV